MISAKLFFLLAMLLAAFVAVDAQWGYGYGYRPYGYGGYGGGWRRPWGYGRGYGYGYRPYGGYGWGK